MIIKNLPNLIFMSQKKKLIDYQLLRTSQGFMAKGLHGDMDKEEKK